MQSLQRSSAPSSGFGFLFFCSCNSPWYDHHELLALSSYRFRVQRSQTNRTRSRGTAGWPSLCVWIGFVYSSALGKMQVIAGDLGMRRVRRASASEDVPNVLHEALFSDRQTAQLESTPDCANFRPAVVTGTIERPLQSFVDLRERYDPPQDSFSTPQYMAPENLHPGVIVAIVLSSFFIAIGLFTFLFVKPRRSRRRLTQLNEKQYAEKPRRRRRQQFVRLICSQDRSEPLQKERTSPTYILPVFSTHATINREPSQSTTPNTTQTQEISAPTPSVLFTSVIYTGSGDVALTDRYSTPMGSPRTSYQHGISQSRRMRSSQMISFTDRSWEDDWVHVPPRRPPSAKLKERCQTA
ncbi:hypothetical protein BC629DRAFT_911535 [Irpex lacteus]|nr:hypothetical protein BC629DRAFT_911535 [Irpex lacteus]